MENRIAYSSLERINSKPVLIFESGCHQTFLHLKDYKSNTYLIDNLLPEEVQHYLFQPMYSDNEYKTIFAIHLN
ncbi:hypothetical protein [Fulvivirga sp.]|uniref:hypothetical protein n=1 Tax=Fulvivirga sp. TaxID=1931237 RepID=UPI0032EF1045